MVEHADTAILCRVCAANRMLQFDFYGRQNAQFGWVAEEIHSSARLGYPLKVFTKEDVDGLF